MKILKKKKGLYAYNGTDADAIQFLTAFKQVFGIDLLQYLGDKPISAPLADSLRAFETNMDDILPEAGTENRQTLIDSGALQVLTDIQNKGVSLINYIYELKNWYANKLTSGKVVYMPATFGVPAKYMYVANTVFDANKVNALCELELGDIMKTYNINLTTPMATWDNILKTYDYKNRWTQKYNAYFFDNFKQFLFDKMKSAGQNVGVSTTTTTTTGNDTSNASNNPTETYVEGNLTENDAMAFLHEIEKYAPINWGNLQYWYKELLAKKKEVSKEVFAFAYDYWLKKLNAEYMTFDAARKEKEKADYDLINGFIFERPAAKKKYGLFATILRKIFNKK